MAPNPLQQLGEHGQSVWLDYISRELVTSGELEKLIETSNVTGLTSNPTIFEKAIAQGNDYDAQISDLLDAGTHDIGNLFFDLAISDIQRACDVLRPVWDRTNGADGFASLEVSPRIAADTDATIAMAHSLWDQVARPNLMVKIPATPAGIPAIERCLRDGININVTLIFALSAHEQVINAYISALEGRLSDGKPLNVHSVASFFVSRVDTETDKRLEAIGNTALQGKAAIANAVLAYELFEKHFVHGDRFKPLRDAGAPVQRPLWASTSAKNPNYRDVLYAESLVGPDTVDTMPPSTVDAFRDHGIVADTVRSDYPGAHAVMGQLEAAGIDMDDVTEALLTAGVASFTASYDELISGLSNKVSELRGGHSGRQSFWFEGGESSVLAEWLRANDGTGVAERLWERDANLWKPGDADAAAVVANRLGWLDVITTMRQEAPRLEQLSKDLATENVRDVVLLGMGGSSLCPEVLRTAFEPQSDHPTLHVLDTTDPAAIKNVSDAINPEHTIFVVASKSGKTIETLSHFSHFHQLVSSAGVTNPGSHFIAVTDPGSHLADVAQRNGFRATFLNPADIGGRYSALSFFGLVPAACAGLDLGKILDRAGEMRAHCAAGMSLDLNPGLVLGAAMAHFHDLGRDKVTILASDAVATFSLWAEQLIAESTGKEGKGIIPIGAEPLGEPDVYGKDRLFVALRVDGDNVFDGRVEALRKAGNPVLTLSLSDAYDLGAEFFRWEFATAVAGAHLAIDPFDEPNVQESKDNTAEVLKGYAATGSLPTEEAVGSDGEATFYGATLTDILGAVKPGDYVALMAYVTPDEANTAALQSLRTAIRDTQRVATTLGFGPRFLHSTGQLHKGGPNTGVYVQITTDDIVDVAIPDQTFTFSILKQAQAAGDLASLRSHDRRVIRIHVNGDLSAALAHLTDTIRHTAGVAR